MQPMLNTAVKAARKAGDIILKAHDRISSIKIKEKSSRDYVTEIDQKAEREIIEILRKAYPSHGFLGEESGASEGDDHTWIIDPIDGTTNFIHGIPHYCVSIGLAIKQQIYQAVIYDPIKDELFTASRGAGAQLNGHRLRVNPRKGIEGALLSLGVPIDQSDKVSQLLKELAPTVSGIRRTGSAALDLAYVASGRLDGYCEVNLSPWDIAAGSLLVREAGGLVGALDGSENYLDSGNIIAASPKVFSSLLKLTHTFR